jgi:hypothetical protein
MGWNGFSTSPHLSIARELVEEDPLRSSRTLGDELSRDIYSI